MFSLKKKYFCRQFSRGDDSEKGEKIYFFSVFNWGKKGLKQRSERVENSEKKRVDLSILQRQQQQYRTPKSK